MMGCVGQIEVQKCPSLTKFLPYSYFGDKSPNIISPLIDSITNIIIFFIIIISIIIIFDNFPMFAIFASDPPEVVAVQTPVHASLGWGVNISCDVW